MLTIKTNALTEKGALRPAVRTAVKENIVDIKVVLGNGTEVSLANMGNGDYFAPIATCEDGVAINGKVNLTITVNDYKAPAKHKAPVKEAEAIDIE